MPSSIRPAWRHAAPSRILGQALLAILLILSGPAVGAAPPEPDPVRAAALRDYIHGMTPEIARDTVGEAGVPVLLMLLADPEFPRRDNVVAFLTYLGGPRSTQALLAFLRHPPAAVTVPEEDRALLLVPQALGHIAARGDASALQALLAMTADGSGGGVLASAAAMSPRPDALRDDLLEMALRGLAFSRDAAARDRIAAIASGAVTPAPGGRALDRAAASARELLDSLDHPSSAPAPSAGLTASRTSAVTDPAAMAHEHRIDYANHVDHNNPMTDMRLDQVLSTADGLVGLADFAEDVACCVTLVRKGTGLTFGTPGDGLDVIDDLNEQIAVQVVDVARVKVVRLINFCGTTGSNILGCSGVGGNTMTLVRRTNLTSEAILWTHEYGHNLGLSHNPDSRYIMYASLTGSNNGLTAAECDKFHNPSPFAQADMVGTGACEPPVCGDGFCNGGESCNNCPADCISNPGAVCGNGVCEAGDGEDCVSCSLDCNGMQSGSPGARFCCGAGGGQNPVPCSDTRCTASGYQCTDVPAVPYCCGDLVCEGAETQLSCDYDCGPAPTQEWYFSGTALGGTIDFTISGVPLQIVTVSGMTAAQVATAIAAEINNDPTLSSMYLKGWTSGNGVITTGTIDDYAVNDAGLGHSLPEVPALSWNGLALVFLLLAGGIALSRRARR